MLNDSAASIRNNKILHIMMYILLLNFILDALLTFVNIFTVPNYIHELIEFGIQNVLLFVILMIFVLITTIVPIIIGQNYKNWSEEKQTRVFFRILSILSISSITILSIIIYATIYQSYPTLLGSNTLFNPFYRVWWYFSFNLGPILIFLLYIYLES